MEPHSGNGGAEFLKTSCELFNDPRNRFVAMGAVHTAKNLGAEVFLHLGPGLETCAIRGYATAGLMAGAGHLINKMREQ